MTLEELKKLLSDAPLEVVADVEHLPDADPGLASLLGVALCWPGSLGVYVPVNHWIGGPSKVLEPTLDVSALAWLQTFLSERTLMGWNLEHDRLWIDAAFNIVSMWSIDGRILWYLTDTEQNDRGYGLKRAQVKLLGWPVAGDKILRDVVYLNGGDVDHGDHYLADVFTLGSYAASDAYSTLCVIQQVKDSAEWCDALERSHNSNRDYAAFLSGATQRGTTVDVEQLRIAQLHYQEQVAQATAAIGQVCAAEISELEQRYLNKHLMGLKTERGKSAFLAAPSRQPRFNPNSSKQRSELLHDVIGLPVLENTKKGAPKSDRATIAKMNHPSAKAFTNLSVNEKLLQFTEQYLKSAKQGLIHFPHDTTATVSERLGKDGEGGYAAYDLNMPFSSQPIMQAFRVRPGFLGVHMDLVSIEPCLIAGFSGDETMLKVYRDGLGDIYLDLCLDVFPLDERSEYGEAVSALITAFHKEYDSHSPPSGEIKEKFARLRKIAKIVQLAVGYTGTKYTVSKNLTQAGFPTSQWKAEAMVKRYWKRFAKVERLAAQLKKLAENRGYITGFYGRKLHVPKRQSKDALNRFAQFGGHAVLRDIVLRIASAAGTVGMHPLLPDIHDSTSWEVPEQRYQAGVDIFTQAITACNKELALPITIKGEIKQFKTFYGLKNKEE